MITEKEEQRYIDFYGESAAKRMARIREEVEKNGRKNEKTYATPRTHE